MPKEEIEPFLMSLSHNALASLPYLFDIWAHPHQRAPEGDWKTWVVLGGRGAGKTRAGAEWVRSKVEGARPEDPGECRRVALVSETLEQARNVMVFGDSGILACSPPDRRPKWEATKRQLVWPNGAQAQLFSAVSPEMMRGPQFDAAWLDELAKWPSANKAWDQVQFSLRLGAHPQQVVTTTPKTLKTLREILEADDTVMTHAPTAANEAFLADNFVGSLMGRFGGTRMGREELGGELLEEAEGALWTYKMIDACHRPAPSQFDRIVVAVDPPVTSGGSADACGIVVVGAVMQGPPAAWQGWVLEDASLEGASPQTWAAKAVDAYHQHNADRLVAEVNQGGDLVEDLIRQVDPMVSYLDVRASKGKVARAEPVAALYEQSRMHHAANFEALEDQMSQMAVGGFAGRGSPDRVDALVWAVTELMIRPAHAARPAIRSL